MTRLPKYVQAFIDRTGKPRHYIRRRGYPRTALPGVPWSPTFMAAYEEAMTQQAPMPATKIGHVKPGSFRALAVSYLASPAFANLSDNSKRGYRGTIEAFCQTKDANGGLYGDKPLSGLNRGVIVKILSTRADKPRAANKLLMLLRILMQHGVDHGMVRENPARDIRPLKVKAEGHHSWTEEEIAQFESHWPVGSKERLALALLLYTGQRGRSDVSRMGRQHLIDTDDPDVPSGKLLRITQQKTGAELVIPVHVKLLNLIEQTASNNLTFLTTRTGRPYHPNAFGNWFRQSCDKAGLPHCSAHGLRKASARRIADEGGSEHHIASVTGHASLSEVRRYTRGANQKKLAIAAMPKIK
jgi:integrase